MYQVDVRTYRSVASAFKRIESDLGKADVLVACHGINDDAKLKDMLSSQWNRVIEVNLTGTFNCLKASVSVMKPDGQILVMSSIGGDKGLYGAANYAASKSGLSGLVRSAAKEFARAGVRVNMLTLGYFNAGMGDRLPPKVRDMATERSLLHRFGTSEEFCAAVLGILSSSYATGQVFTVDGGVTL